MCEFDSGGVCCRGWFHRPNADPPYACVVMAHGFGAAPETPLGDVARRIAQAGLAAFAFDFRGFGASEGEPRAVLSARRQLEDWAAAIAHVRSRDDVEPDQVGLWGSSFTGGQVLAVAAGDHRIAAAVAQVPYCDGLSLAYAAGLVSNLRLLPAVIRDLRRAATGAEPYMIDALGPPGRQSAISARFPDLYSRILERMPAWPNKTAARAVLQMYAFRPIRLASQIRCPLLVVLSYHDQVAPPAAAVRAAQRLPHVELALFRARHFDLYVGETRERALRTELRFITHHMTNRGLARAL